MPGNPQLVVPVPITLQLGIECDQITVAQPGGEESVLVLDPALPWNLSLRFRLGGQNAANLVAANLQGQVTFFFETFGGPPEGSIGPVFFNTGAGAPMGGLVWQYNVTTPNQPAGLIAAGAVAKLSAVVRIFGMTGFIEGLAISQE